MGMLNNYCYRDSKLIWLLEQTPQHHLQKLNTGLRDAQQLKVLATFTKDLDPVPSTHVAAHNRQ